MITIRPIQPIETFAVRQPVLRPGKPVESCIFPGDELPSTIHFGLFADNILAGVISVFEAENEIFEQQGQFQVRGMAVLGDYQKKGFGEKLMQQAEKHVAEKHGKLIWFNARENAVPFYTKTGYQITGSPFDIPGIGIHFVMYKYLI